jgi:predicted 2-oxoglutarate/Fe(II)-dependent dioxygenase YbiX
MQLVRAFGAPEAAELVAKLRALAEWEPATVGATDAVDASVRAASVLDARTHRALIRWCRDRLYDATRAIAAEGTPFSVLADVQIVRYTPGERYAEHTDISDLGMARRVLSLVCYLNDDFQGGETVFTDPPATIRPQAGMTLVFPPHERHRAEPIVAGEKYVIVAWYLRPEIASG